MIWRNNAKKIVKTNSEKPCITTEYVTVTMDMCYNILLKSFKGEQSGPNYYLSAANIYGLDIIDASNNICYVYTWT